MNKQPDPALVITVISPAGPDAYIVKHWLRGFFDSEGFLCFVDPTCMTAIRYHGEPKEIQLFEEWDAAGLNWDRVRGIPPDFVPRSQRLDIPKSRPGDREVSKDLSSSLSVPVPTRLFYRRVPTK